jgi:hypothetical protein
MSNANDTTSRDGDDDLAVTETDYTEAATCADGGYSLRSLPERRCPECGRAFDPHDPDTMNVPGRQKPSPLRLLTFGQEMVRSGAVAMAILILGRLSLNPILIVYGVAMWGAILATWGVRSITRGRFPPLPEGPRWRVKVATLLLITLLMPTRAYSCPHATTVWFFAFGISHSDGNGPCHNGPHRGGFRIIGPWFYAYPEWI